jgi:hypothetical protein
MITLSSSSTARPFPFTPDFDLECKDYSWADLMVRQGYVVYMFDKRKAELWLLHARGGDG